MSKESTTTGGITFSGVLTILFIALKLTNKIDWDWFWVLSPLLIPIGIIVTILVFFLLIVFCVWVYASIGNKG